MIAFAQPTNTVSPPGDPPPIAVGPVRLAALLWRCLACGLPFAGDEPAGRCPWCGGLRVECLDQ